MKNNVSLFLESPDGINNFERIGCDRCGQQSEAYYTLSHLTKTLYIRCKKCGNHAAPYQFGLNILWKPSKSFIKEVGLEEAMRQAREAEKTKGQSQLMVDNKSGVERKEPKDLPEVKLYCDAGTANNGQKGRQRTIVVITDETGKVVFEKQIGDYSNNEGEILGIIACLRDFTSGKPVLVQSDSQVATNWANRGWTQKNENSLKKGKLTERHKKFITMAHELLIKTDSVVAWILRDQNLAGHYIEEKFKL